MTHRVMFCVGAAKAGTSWLHRTLSDHGQCHFRSIKELHYFDALEFGHVEREIEDVAARRDRFLAEAQGADTRRRDARLRQAADCDDWLAVLERGEDSSAYMGFLTKDAPAGALVGDMTPAYSLLSVDRLAHMARIAPDVRFVYLLRDPVDRLWSHVRMIAARRAAKNGVSEGRERRILERVFSGEETEIIKRSDYSGALGRLGRAVDPRRFCVAFYETLFGGESLSRIAAFLGLDGLRGDVTRRIHPSPEATLPAELADRAGRWLAAQYDHVAAMLGHRPAGWRYDLAKV